MGSGDEPSFTLTEFFKILGESVEVINERVVVAKEVPNFVDNEENPSRASFLLN